MQRLLARVTACDVHGWLESILTAALEESGEEGARIEVVERDDATSGATSGVTQRGDVAGDGHVRRIEPTRRAGRSGRLSLFH